VELIDGGPKRYIITTVITDPTYTPFWVSPEIGTSWFTRVAMCKVRDGRDEWIAIEVNFYTPEERKGYP
jgi:hypothetical protein